MRLPMQPFGISNGGRQLLPTTFVASLVLIGVGLILALFGNVRTGVVTSVTSTITAVFSKLARPLYKEALGNVTDMQRKLVDEIKNLRPTSHPGKATD